MSVWRRRAAWAGLAVGAVVAGAAAVVTYVQVSSGAALGVTFPRAHRACYNAAAPDSEAGLGGAAVQLDASTEAGPSYLVTLSGTARVPMAITVYDGDFANPISGPVAADGDWTAAATLSTGWHKLIFRGVADGRVFDEVRWLGLDSDTPSWANPWGYDDAGCPDSGCPPIGSLIRCSNGEEHLDGGCAEAGCGTHEAGTYRPHATREGRWCKVNAPRGYLEVHANFSTAVDRGCGVHSAWVHVTGRTLGWPPPDAGYACDDAACYDAAASDTYTHDTYIASAVDNWKFLCRPWNGGTWPSVPAYPDAGPRGTPVCAEGFCCVMVGIHE